MRGQQGEQDAWQIPTSSPVNMLQPQLALSSAFLIDWSAVAKAFKQQPEILVFVPIFNAPAELKACLAALLRHPAGISQVILLDDSSTDPAVAALLQPYKLHPWFQCFRHHKRAGLAACWQRALQIMTSRGQDGVLLHPQWQVSAGWLTQLRLAAYARAATAAQVATVSADQQFRFPFVAATVEHKQQLQQHAARMMTLTAAPPRPINLIEPSGCWYLCAAAVERVMAAKDEATLFDINYFIHASTQQGDCHLQSHQAVVWPTGRSPSRYRPLTPKLQRAKQQHSHAVTLDDHQHTPVLNPQEVKQRFPARRMLLAPFNESVQSVQQSLLARQSAILLADPTAGIEDWLLFLPTPTKLKLFWVQLDALASADATLAVGVVLAEHHCIADAPTIITTEMEAILLQWLAYWCVEIVDLSCCQLSAHLGGKPVTKTPDLNTQAWALLCQQWCQRLAIECIADFSPVSRGSAASQ